MNRDVRIEMPYEAEWIIKKIRERGFEAFAVGGCVRDTLLGRTPGDWDITTSAKPEEVKAIFGKTVDTGLQHGTVTIIKNRKGYEVTTYRIDGEYRPSPGFCGIHIQPSGGSETPGLYHQRHGVQP